MTATDACRLRLGFRATAGSPDPLGSVVDVIVLGSAFAEFARLIGCCGTDNELRGGGRRGGCGPETEASKEYVAWWVLGEILEVLDMLAWLGDALLCVRRGRTVGSDGPLFDGKGNWKSAGDARLRSRSLARAVREAIPVTLLCDRLRFVGGLEVGVTCKKSAGTEDD